jgi:hypothetical protein
MNQTIHTHQLLHAFASRDDAREGRLRAGGIGPRRPNERNEKRGHFVGARRVVITVLMLVPLIVTELVIGEIARDGWIADVLNQTAQLIVLAQPF